MTRFALLFFVAACAWAQTASTQILGLVTDATGAAVPGATITARRTETGDVRTTTSNNTGNYIFPLVDSGAYDWGAGLLKWGGYPIFLSHALAARRVAMELVGRDTTSRPSSTIASTSKA